jgi:hypothetical protein
MQIEKIIYNTTRNIYNVEDKLSIATIFLFCYNFSSKLFSELLYTDDHGKFIDKINNEFKEYDVNFTIRLNDKNVRICFIQALEKVKKKYDANGYHKALFDKDPFALVIGEMVSYNFDAAKLKKFTKGIAKRFKFNF